MTKFNRRRIEVKKIAKISSYPRRKSKENYFHFSLADRKIVEKIDALLKKLSEEGKVRWRWMMYYS